MSNTKKQIIAWSDYYNELEDSYFFIGVSLILMLTCILVAWIIDK
jgi:hypothetical protein